MHLLSKAIILSASTHDQDVDKGKNPYILHPTRVAANVMSAKVRRLAIFKDVPHEIFAKAVIVAWLHDVVEDTRKKKNPVTYDMLRADGFGEDIIAALDCVTDRDGETYPEFITRCMTNIIAMIVKICDIIDNMDLSRIPNPTEKDYQRVAFKYVPALFKIGAGELVVDEESEKAFIRLRYSGEEKLVATGNSVEKLLNLVQSDERIDLKPWGLEVAS